MATLCSKHPSLREVQPTGSAPAPIQGPSFGPGPDCLGQTQALCHLASWRGRGVGPWPAGLPGALRGGSLRHTISRPAFDLGQGLPASKWSQLLLQAEANGQKGAGGGGLEARGVWRREDSGASGNHEGVEKLESCPFESKRQGRGKVWSPFPLCK